MGGGGAVGLWANGNDAPDGQSHYGYSQMGALLNVEKGDLNQYDYYNCMTDGGADDHENSGYPTVEALQEFLVQKLVTAILHIPIMI